MYLFDLLLFFDARDGDSTHTHTHIHGYAWASFCQGWDRLIREERRGGMLSMVRAFFFPRLEREVHDMGLGLPV